MSLLSVRIHILSNVQRHLLLLIRRGISLLFCKNFLALLRNVAKKTRTQVYKGSPQSGRCERVPFDLGSNKFLSKAKEGFLKACKMARSPNKMGVETESSEILMKFLLLTGLAEIYRDTLEDISSDSRDAQRVAIDNEVLIVQACNSFDGNFVELWENRM